MTVLIELRSILDVFDGRSLSVLSDASEDLKGRDGYHDALMKLAVQSDRKRSIGATWLLKHELEAGWIASEMQISTIIAGLRQVKFWEAQLHVCQSVRFLKVPESDVQALLSWLRDLLEHKRPFVRAWALDAICSLAGYHASLGVNLNRLISDMERDPAASVRARIRQLNKIN